MKPTTAATTAVGTADMVTPELGVIEGFFGRPYDWQERAEMVRSLAPAGYAFYLFAPKAAAKLRRRWREPFDEDELAALAAFAETCRASDVRFGIGLSPYDLFRDFDAASRSDLAGKLNQLASLRPDDLGILFDDMPGGLPDLAARQVEIVEWIAARGPAPRLVVCPSYYADDAVLDRVFGERPPRYLEDLGASLDPAIHLAWTGEEVCAREIDPEHLDRVGERMQRRPFLWDNYPVNDGPRMSRHLHLRAFTGRPASIGPRLAAHGINPASQPVLSRIPARTLPESYAEGENYDPDSAFDRATRAVLGPDLADAVARVLPLLVDVGRDELGEVRTARLRELFASFDHPAAREIVAWLDGAWSSGSDDIQTQ